MKFNKTIQHQFQRTDNSHDRQDYIRLFADLYEHLNGEQKEVLRFTNNLLRERDMWCNRMSNHYHDERGLLPLEKLVGWYKKKMHPSRHNTFDEIYPLLLDVLSAKEKIAYANTMIRKLLIDEMLDDLDEN